MEQILSILSAIKPLSTSIKDFLQTKLKKEIVNKRTLIVQPEIINKRIYFIEHGIVRAYFINETV